MIGLAVVSALIAVGATMVWWLWGSTKAFWALAPTLLLLAALASHRIALLQAVLLIAAATTCGWLMGRPVLGAVAGVLFLVYAFARSRKLPSDLQADAFALVHSDSVGDGAEEFVTGFRRLGYRQVGALSTPINGFELIISIMIGPDRDRYASVTDATITVTSTFGYRSLVTRNSALSLLAPEMLDNPVVGGTPASLDAAHNAALALITPKVGAPDTLDPDAVTAQALASEQREVSWVRSQPTHLQRGGNRERTQLAAEARIEQIISTWLNVPSST